MVRQPRGASSGLASLRLADPKWGDPRDSAYEEPRALEVGRVADVDEFHRFVITVNCSSNSAHRFSAESFVNYC
jgi:hypothetical protein